MLESFIYSGINIYTCGDLKKKEMITLYEPLKEKYIKNLQYLNSNIEIDFYYDDYENIFKCINSLDNNYKKIKIRIGDKEKFRKSVSKENLKKIDLNKIDIHQFMTVTSLADYIYFENILYKMIEPAKKLSPLEKYIYAYNIVKNYKDYKECDENMMYSRQLYRVLFNDYIVCVGFSRFLSDLLTKLDINNRVMDVMVEDEEIKDEYIINHERLYVYLKDEKYKINGYYLSDPTWDNHLKLDLYTYMLITNSKNDLAKVFQYDDNFIIFNIKTIEDFYSKCKEIKERFKMNDFDTIEYVLKFLKYLEPNIYNSIINSNNYKKRNINNILEEIGKHLINRVNKEINQKKLWKGVRAVYNNSYGYRNICAMNNEIKKVIKYNNIREKNNFYYNKKQKVLKKINYDSNLL